MATWLGMGTRSRRAAAARENIPPDIANKAQLLSEMGFPIESCVAALVAEGGNEERAINTLLAMPAAVPAPAPPPQAPPSQRVHSTIAASARNLFSPSQSPRSAGGKNCSICLDVKPQGSGLCCTHNHFICMECFSPYVDSLCDDVGRLKQATFEVACPVPRCTAPHWSVSDVRTGLQPRSLEKYISTLVRVCKQQAGDGPVDGQSSSSSSSGTSGGAVAVAKAALLESFSLKCPNQRCRCVLDPNPDGCCAMRCLRCATFFCWLCFSIHRDSPACHAHVAVCPRSLVPGVVFVDRAVVDHAHRGVRIDAARPILERLYFDLNPGEVNCTPAKMRACAGVVEVLRSCQRELSDLQLTADDLLSGKAGGGALLTLLTLSSKFMHLMRDLLHQMRRSRQISGNVVITAAIAAGGFMGVLIAKGLFFLMMKALTAAVFIMGALYGLHVHRPNFTISCCLCLVLLAYSNLVWILTMMVLRMIGRTVFAVCICGVGAALSLIVGGL